MACERNKSVPNVETQAGTPSALHVLEGLFSESHRAVSHMYHSDRLTQVAQVAPCPGCSPQRRGNPEQADAFQVLWCCSVNHSACQILPLIPCLCPCIDGLALPMQALHEASVNRLFMMCPTDSTPRSGYDPRRCASSPPDVAP